jgi:hypothetical protein
MPVSWRRSKRSQTWGSEQLGYNATAGEYTDVIKPGTPDPIKVVNQGHTVTRNLPVNQDYQ